MNASTYTTDTAECESFAHQWLARTKTPHITLTAIPAAGGATSTTTFAPDTFPTMRRWIDAHQGQTRNIYFQVNETMPGCRKKPSKGEMIAAVCRHADIDPVDATYPWLEERERLHRLADLLHNDPAMPPTFLLDSGNGIYPLWVTERQLLAPGVDVVVEDENKEVEAAVGANGTFNIDRLLRLPGTLNFPNAKKLKLGRGITRARILFSGGRLYTSEQAAELGEHLTTVLQGSELVRPHVASDTTDAGGKQREKPRRQGTRDRSAVAFRKGAELRRQGKSFDEMCEALANDPETQDWYQEKGEANDKRELRRVWDRSAERDEKVSGQPTIKVIAGNVHNTATAAEDALVASGLPIYQRGDSLVQPVSREVSASRGRMTIAAGLGELNVHSTVDLMSATATYKRFDLRSEEWIDINPPPQVAQILLSRNGRWRVPAVAGVITTPTLRHDGTILIFPGYDATTRLYHVADPSLKLHPDVHRPTRAAAEGALQALANLLTEFPFTSAVAMAVALSGLITPVVRGALSVAPLHLYRANTPGSGKSYLADVTAAITTGRPCPVISAAPDEGETEKRLAGLLLAGYPLISVDNVNGELGGDLFCQAIERPLIRLRRLGASDITEIESVATILATGNNARVRGDMVRRTIVADLDAKEERPELRKFSGNPVATVLADRGRYVSACLVIVRAYILAGTPNAPAPLASFEDWSTLVRGALMWLGCADPVTSMEAAREDDPELSELREMLTVWSSSIGTDSKTTREVAEAIDEREPTKMGEPTDYRHPELREMLLRVFGERGSLNTKRLAKWLASKEGRIVAGKRFKRAVTLAQGGVTRWQIETI